MTLLGNDTSHAFVAWDDNLIGARVGSTGDEHVLLSGGDVDEHAEEIRAIYCEPSR